MHCWRRATSGHEERVAASQHTVMGHNADVLLYTRHLHPHALTSRKGTHRNGDLAKNSDPILTRGDTDIINGLRHHIWQDYRKSWVSIPNYAMNGRAEIKIDKSASFWVAVVSKQDILMELEELSGIKGNHLLFGLMEGLELDGSYLIRLHRCVINGKECWLRGIHAYPPAERLKTDEATPTQNRSLYWSGLSIKASQAMMEGLDKEDPFCGCATTCVAAGAGLAGSGSSIDIPRRRRLGAG